MSDLLRSTTHAAGRNPRVAVCLAARNGMRWIGQQIQSIAAQTDVDATILVSVDLSTDGTEGYVRELGSHNPAIRMLPYGERFGSAAGNFFRMLKEVDFEDFDFVALADQDDIWNRDKLSRAITELERCKADGYSSNVIAFWENGREAYIDKAQPQRRWDFLFEAAGAGCTYVLRSSVASLLGNCLRRESQMAERIEVHDWLIYAFARANGFTWIIDRVPGMYYRQHAHNELGLNKGLRAYWRRARRLLDGWGLGQSLLIAQVVGLGSAPFVARWRERKRLDFLWLATQSWHCRRRRRDRVLFGMLCLSLALLGCSTQFESPAGRDVKRNSSASTRTSS